MMIEIGQNLFRLTLPMPFRLMHVHVYLCLSESGVTLFDAGLNTTENFRILENALSTLGRTVKDIRQIFITHFHADHCGLAGLIKELSGAKIFMSPYSKKLLGRRQNQFFLERLQEFCLKCGLSQTLTNVLAKMFVDFKEVPHFFEADDFLREEVQYQEGNLKWEAILTPGHSPDHISFYFPEEKILIAGDHCLPEITPNLSPDILNPAYEPLREFLHSLDRIRSRPVNMVLPAHGGIFHDLESRLEELKKHHQLRKELTLKAVSTGPKDIYRVSCDLFGENLSDFDRFLAINETFVHLKYLVKEGEVKEDLQKGILYYEAKRGDL